MTDEKDPETTVTIPTKSESVTKSTIRIDGKEYVLPPHVLRLDVGAMIDIPSCGLSVRAVKPLTVEQRAGEALAFLARTLRMETEAGIDATTEDEIKRFGGGKAGARECYANLLALRDWMTLFYGDVAEHFLCGKHQDIARVQSELGYQYMVDNNADERESLAQAFLSVFGQSGSPATANLES